MSKIAHYLGKTLGEEPFTSYYVNYLIWRENIFKTPGKISHFRGKTRGKEHLKVTRQNNS